MSNLKIEILGAGCPKCKKTTELFRRAVAELGVDVEVIHITDINEMINRGVMTTPAVFINGKKVVEGKVPAMPEVKSIIEKEK